MNKNGIELVNLLILLVIALVTLVVVTVTISGGFSDLRDKFPRVSSVVDKDPEILVFMFNKYYNSKDYVKALEYYLSLVKVALNNDKARDNLGVVDANFNTLCLLKDNNLIGKINGQKISSLKEKDEILGYCKRINRIKSRFKLDS